MMREDISTVRERGFTLVELMIALVIGLALTIVIASLFIHSRSTYGATDEMSRMQENIRFAQDLLTRMVHHTSYIATPNAYRDTEDASNNSGATVVFNAANPGFAATDGGAASAPDTFTVRFEGSGPAGAPDGTITDCQGRELDGTQIAVNLFHLAIGQNGGMSLFCQSTINGANFSDVEVVPNVDNMKLIYGEDLVDSLGSPARDGSAERYVPLAGVTNTNKIVALRVALLFSTSSAGDTAIVQQSNRTYNLNGNVVGPFTDKRVRRVITMTISMRNRSA